ncbi:hypothetical protein MJ1HA_1755 [Metallosphaera sedula]|nr:hypothetical protein MJ1HA_1755 [Metallosphaera sedula]
MTTFYSTNGKGSPGDSINQFESRLKFRLLPRYVVPGVSKLSDFDVIILESIKYFLLVAEQERISTVSRLFTLEMEGVYLVMSAVKYVKSGCIQVLYRCSSQLEYKSINLSSLTLFTLSIGNSSLAKNLLNRRAFRLPPHFTTLLFNPFHCQVNLELTIPNITGVKASPGFIVFST